MLTPLSYPPQRQQRPSGVPGAHRSPRRQLASSSVEDITSHASNVRFLRYSGHVLLHCTCPLLTQSGHGLLRCTRLLLTQICTPARKPFLANCSVRVMMPEVPEGRVRSELRLSPMEQDLATAAQS